MAGDDEKKFAAALDKLYAQKARAMGKRPDDPAVQAVVDGMIDRAGGKFNPKGDVKAQIAARRQAVISLSGTKTPAKPAPASSSSRSAAVKKAWLTRKRGGAKPKGRV